MMRATIMDSGMLAKVMGDLQAEISALQQKLVRHEQELDRLRAIIGACGPSPEQPWRHPH
jgi:hypothetical protein